jgi:hypothetical protein
VGSDGKIKGFDIDIANALCAEMKAECEFSVQDFDDSIPALHSVPTLTMWDGVRCVRYKLWDPERGRLVTWAEAAQASSAH